MGGFADGVLLESTIDGIAREKGLGAEGFVALHAKAAGETRSIEPLYGNK